MIVFKNVSKIYNGVTALDKVSFEIRQGEFTALVGKSGAGKSTVLKLITREERPAQGKIFYRDKDFARLRPKEINLLRRKITTIFQEFRLIPSRTVRENIAFAMEVCGRSDQDIQREVPNILDLVGLPHKMHAFSHELSGGEKQRVAIARAVVLQPEVILADEPTGNLDPLTGIEIIKLLQKINQLGTTIILATHNRDVVNTLKSRVITIERGRIIKDELAGSYTLA